MHTFEFEIKNALAMEAMKLDAFSLNQPGSAWFIDKGNIDIFAVKWVEGEVVGARHHVYRTGENEFLLGIDTNSINKAYEFLAVATPGTVFYRLDPDKLTNISMFRVINSWVRLITRNVPTGIQPKHYIPAGHEFSLVIKKGDILSTVHPLVWVRCTKGSVAFLGQPDLDLCSESYPLPLSQNTWLVALDDSALESCSIEQILQAGRMWEVVSSYTRLIYLSYLKSRVESEHSEVARLNFKRGNSSALMEKALVGFCSILEPKHELPFTHEDDALLAACKIIGERISINFKAPAASGKLRNNPVENIALASNVRIRSVALKGKWWIKDHGPMLAFYGPEKTPVALLPLHGNRYELCASTEDKPVPVTSDVADKLEPFAYVFYRTFDPVAVDVPALIRFSMVELKRDIVAVAMIGLIAGMVGMVVPILTGKFFDSVIPSADRSDLWQMVAILMAVTMALAAFQFSRTVAMLRIEGKMDAGVQAAVWDRVLNLPMPFFREFSAGELAMRINGINTIRKELSLTTVSAILTGIFSIFNFGLLFYYSIPLALLASALVLAASLLTIVLGYTKLRYDRQLSEIQGKLSGRVLQYLSGIAKLKVSGAETRAFSNWAKDFAFQEKLSFKSGSVNNLAESFFSALPLIISMALFAAIGNLMMKQRGIVMTTGEFIAFNSALGSFLYASLHLSSSLFSILNIIPIYERAKPILRTLPEVDQTTVDPGELSGGIEVANVSFSYVQNGPLALDNISFSITPGEFVAVVGPSGSGKSTLFRQLLRFERPISGSIYFDGKDLADLDPRAVRRQFGVVLQNGQLLSGDIFTNIVGSSMLTQEDAWEAARLCGLEEDVKNMPMGMHTHVSEGCSTLSGGQRQRILIARAIIHRPRILLFDEATSALDNHTQAIISKSLEQLKATRMVIAHRLSTIINADRILVLQEGKLVQQGKYDDLVNAEGTFKDLAWRQLA